MSHDDRFSVRNPFRGTPPPRGAENDISITFDQMRITLRVWNRHYGIQNWPSHLTEFVVDFARANNKSLQIWFKFISHETGKIIKGKNKSFIFGKDFWFPDILSKLANVIFTKEEMKIVAQRTYGHGTF